MRMILVLLIFISGCMLNPDDSVTPTNPDHGGYTLHVEPVFFFNIPNGGCLEMVYIKPDADFAGDVEVSIYAEDLSISPKTAVLNKEKTLLEIEVYIDPDLLPGERELEINCLHSGKYLSTTVKIEVKDGEPDSGSNSVGYGKNPQKFIIKGLNVLRPEYPIQADSSWFQFNDNNGGSRFFNTEWEIRCLFRSVITPKFWLWLRKRGDVEPCLYLRSSQISYEPGIGSTWDYEEIPKSLFGFPW